MTDIKFRHDFDVTLVDSMGSDVRVCQAARVSVQGAESYEADESKGLIEFLMNNRHGCYDDETEVLTSDGWKKWPDVDGSETFVTLNMATDEIEYQQAQRVIHKPSDGTMVHISMHNAVDMLVTQDHNMVAAARTHNGWEYDLVPAKEFLERSYRVRLGGGEWEGSLHSPEIAELVGFIAADGHVSKTAIEFSLSKSRKIDWLTARHKVSYNGDVVFRLLGVSEELKSWAKQTYTETGDRCLPKELLRDGDLETLSALLDGILMGDGSVSATGKITLSTVSRQMVDDLQELALKVGIAAVESKSTIQRESAFGTRPVYRLCFYRTRNIEPRIGWTTEARAAQVQTVEYTGNVHCVTVPNSTLYVRRNGRPMWCGNSPFEHVLFTWLITAPIFVWREFMRHRIASYNEQSGRYTKLDPVFYIIPKHRPFVQEGKTGEYKFIGGSSDVYEEIVKTFKMGAQHQYEDYEYLLSLNVAKEVSRMELPLNIYSSAYVTMNARALMNFLSLRTKNDEAYFVSFPQWEIEQVAKHMEQHFKHTTPLVYNAFNKAKRVSP